MPFHIQKKTDHTVMIIEDNAMLSEMYEYKLEKEWLMVIVKNDGLEAINTLCQMETQPDVILLDLMMPNVDGFEVLETIREYDTERKAKIIVFSNLSEQKDRDRCFKLGADEFLLKASITPAELVVKVRSLLD